MSSEVEAGSIAGPEAAVEQTAGAADASASGPTQGGDIDPKETISDPPGGEDKPTACPAPEPPVRPKAELAAPGRPGSSSHRRPRWYLSRVSTLVAFLGLASAIGLAFYLLRPFRFLQSAAASGTEELVISPRSLSVEISSPGALRATSVQNFGGPPGFGSYWQFQIVSLVPEGKNVKKGDLLIGFDAQKVTQDLQQFQSELEQAGKELEKTRVQIDLERQDLAAKLAEAENKYATLKLKQAAIPALEASIKIEEDNLALEEARREVESLKEWIEWHKKSSEASYKIIESKRARAEIKVAEIKGAMDNFQAKADRDGVAVYKTRWNGERFQVGETVWTGQPIIEIPDLTTIIAEAFVPEVDIGKINIGQRAEVAIDALPGKSYSGHITAIGRLVHTKSWDIPNRILEAQITLDQLDPSIMRPAMSIKVKIETASLSDVFAVPLKAVHETADGWLVRVRSGTGWRDQPVRLGQSNSTDVVIAEGIRAGDRIAPDYQRAK